MTTHVRPAREAYVRRRFLILFLPLIVAGMAIYMWASIQTLTFNGGSAIGLALAGAAAVAAAWDAGDR